MEYDSLPDAAHPEVVLRPLRTDDLPAWVAYLVLPQVYGPTSWNVQRPEQLAHAVTDPALRDPAASLRLVIADRATDRLLGTIGFHTVQPASRSAEIAYDLAPPAWGRGLARHLCGVLVDWAHQRAGIERVQATVLQGNERSERVLRHCGFAREGLRVAHRLVRGVPGDFWMYAHVREARAT